ncbi:tRNA uridine-5-carboxymethylaminomethyl(34) synthesis GTPase MnmE [Geminicoccaceae bacterium 1502E]|nr:tRNA uridine-5-carboxymethylaminomethyl(34) synthesis GTPase MnmE [Geminicoccaceae bacterium 1502E]
MRARTIFAPATAPGRAGVGIVRLSGPEAASTARLLTGRPLPAPRSAALRLFSDPRDGEPLDRGLLLWMPGPATVTGEDVVELHHHGGRAVRAGLLAALAAVPGLRPAEPGEFTRRAFLNGRLDLTAAEAVADLVDADTRLQARQALRQLDGAFGRRCAAWRETLAAALALAEAEIDFGAEEGDVGESLLAPRLAALRGVAAGIATLLEEAPRGARLREGLCVAVVGAPNAGKSSLVNLLARREVAIVTEIAGTTRDVLEVELELDGLPVTLLDTAGLRESADPIEREGVARARRRAAEADLRLLVVDAREDAAAALEELGGDGEVLLVVNKRDLVPEEAPLPPGALAISCLGAQGIDLLEERLAGAARRLMGTGEGAGATRERHRLALAEARGALDRFLAGHGRIELALAAEELRLAARALGRITGAVGVEEVLDRIFAGFCIGK